MSKNRYYISKDNIVPNCYSCIFCMGIKFKEQEFFCNKMETLTIIPRENTSNRTIPDFCPLPKECE